MKRVDAALGGAVALFLVYVLTLAPGLTFWDAGEFIAAARTLGIPHPPGTPLYILVIHVWARALFFLPVATATNLFSAVATAGAAYLVARLLQRHGVGTVPMLAAVLTAGAMSSAWLNATETEVYAASLLLAAGMLAAGDLAGRFGDAAAGARWTRMTAYLMALAVPLHLSALVAAPVAIALASYGPDDRIRWRRLVLLGGVMLFAMGVGRMSPGMAAVGIVAMVGSQLRAGLVVALVSLLGVSALAFLYLRAPFDPGINQGDPDTWQRFADMVARRQYDVAPMWPRKAPLWLQVANFGQYADWQVALSLGPTVLPSVLRTLFTALFVALGYYGALVVWRADRRLFIALGGLFACGAVGVLVYLNLHAGPSLGWGILPENAPREARERDYFYVFGFWAWGLFAGLGAVAFARRMQRPAWVGLVVACLPIALNWRAVTRRAEPDRHLPMAVAHAFLESTPPNGVLFVVGDNDSYPLWYAQEVRGLRRDVTVITVPLLPTEWYRSQIATRYGLLDSAATARYDGRMEVTARIADGARRLGRPVAAAMTVPARDRARLADSWTATGLVYVPGDAPVDTAASGRVARWVDSTLGRRRPRPAIDPVHSYFRRMLDCPRQILSDTVPADSTRLDSACNYR